MICLSAQGAEYWRGWETEAYSMVNWSPVQITWHRLTCHECVGQWFESNNAGSYIILDWNVCFYKQLEVGNE